MRRLPRSVVLGAILGTAWSASMRGYMAQLAGSESTVTWLGTFGAVLLPGAVVGALLGWASHRRGAVPAWLAWSPLLLAATPLILPGAINTLVRTGLGSGAIGITLLAMLGGWSLSGRGPRSARIPAGVVAYAVVPAAFLAPPMRPELDPATPYGAWLATLLSANYVLLSFACSIPMRRPTHPPRSWSYGWHESGAIGQNGNHNSKIAVGIIALGALCGLAWAAGLRAFMSEVAGTESAATWMGTFGWILVPGATIGALLGWAEHLRRTGGRRGWRWLALSPLLFASVLVTGLVDPGSMFEGGVGGGAIGVPVFGMVGGYALSGRGGRWGRLLCGAFALSAIPVWALVADDVGGADLGIGTPRGAWAALLYYALLAVLALGSAIPHRPLAGDSASPPRDLGVVVGSKSGASRVKATTIPRSRGRGPRVFRRGPRSGTLRTRSSPSTWMGEAWLDLETPSIPSLPRVARSWEATATATTTTKASSSTSSTTAAAAAVPGTSTTTAPSIRRRSGTDAGTGSSPMSTPNTRSDPGGL
jgi:hypothetical protein